MDTHKVNVTASIWCVMDRLEPAAFMDLLLAAHAAEDAFVPMPVDVSIEADLDDIARDSSPRHWTALR